MSEPPDTPTTASPPEGEPTSSQAASGLTIHGGVSSKRDTYLGVNQTINHYTLEQHQTRLKDYQLLLERLATSERARLLTVDEPPLTDGLPLDKLRLIMARAALNWPLPLPEPDGLPLDGSVQRSMVAALLLPLLTTTTLVLTPRANWALGKLASNRVAVLVQRLGVDYLLDRIKLDREALVQAHNRLTRALDDSNYAEGCARLLHNMAMTEAGQTALAVAWHERQRRGGTGQPMPIVLQLFAAGVAGGVGNEIISAVLRVLRTTAPQPPPVTALPSPDPVHQELPPTMAPQPPSPSNPSVLRSTTPERPLSIPVHVSEWQAELDQRNEHFGAPAGYWCYVRPGRYRIGGWEADQPAAHLTLPGFWIARVPITVAQFAAFIDSGGYRERNWWTSKGWRWRVEQECTRPAAWRQPPDNSRPMQAVTGVSWYEARAFCAWLSAHLRLPHSDTVRLPSEAEWEAAAAFDATWQRRTYPWGEAEPTTHHAVFSQSWESGAPDVATRPAGASACGALDLVGTVWEWTSSRYGAYPDGAATVVDDRSTDDGGVPLRGGSWWGDSTFVRCGARDWSPPVNRGDDYRGLRVVVSPLARSDVLVS